MNEPVVDGDYVMLINNNYHQILRWPRFSVGKIYRVNHDNGLFFIYEADEEKKSYGEDLGYWSYKKMTGNLYRLIG